MIFFQHFKRLQQHILYKHTSEKPFKCDKCDFAHALKRGLTGHIRSVHAEKNSLKVCHICCYKTISNQNLKTHIEAKHEKIRNFACPHCDVKFYAKASMAQHIRGMLNSVHICLGSVRGSVTKAWLWILRIGGIHRKNNA